MKPVLTDLKLMSCPHHHWVSLNKQRSESSGRKSDLSIRADRRLWSRMREMGGR